MSKAVHCVNHAGVIVAAADEKRFRCASIGFPSNADAVLLQCGPSILSDFAITVNSQGRISATVAISDKSHG